MRIYQTQAISLIKFYKINFERHFGVNITYIRVQDLVQFLCQL